MGFTLRTVLDVLPSAAFVIVAEFVPAVIQWNREPLAALARYPLRDPRVRIEVADVGFTLRANPGHFDAILLDVDNGPAAFTVGVNAGLYDNSGVAAAYAALCPRGTLAIWSAFEDKKFEQRLRFHGFAVEVVRVRARLKKGGPKHTIFLAHKGPTLPDVAANVSGGTDRACRRGRSPTDRSHASRGRAAPRLTQNGARSAPRWAGSE